MGVHLEYINVGGGFPSSYIKYNDQSAVIDDLYYTDIKPSDVAETIVTTLHKELGEQREIVVEPGRSLVSSSAIMVSRVEGTKKRQNEHWLYLDAGYHTLLDNIAYTWYFHMIPTVRPADEETALFRVVGPLCDNGDSFYDVAGEGTLRRLLAEEPALAEHEALLKRYLIHLPRYRELPASTKPGDLVAFLDVGAYSQENIFGANGRGRSPVVLIPNSGDPRVIRRADSTTDLSFNEISCVI